MDEKVIQWNSRNYSLIAVLVTSLVIAVLVINWSRALSFRPLVQDMRLVDAVKIVDVLEVAEIPYKADIKNHILYVSEAHSDQARLVLARIDMVIDYPDKNSFSTLPKACLLLEQQMETSEIQPIWMQTWFTKVVRLTLGALVIIVLILAVVRPALSALIYPEDKEE